MISSSCSSLPTCKKFMKVEGRMVLVAMKASSKDISNNALLWALTSVVQPHDFLSLLLVLPPPSSGKSLWSFPRFGGDCASGSGDLEHGSELTDSYYNMILKLYHIYDLTKVKVEIKTVYAGGVVAEAKRGSQASWVVLDKQLKHEEKCCMNELHCNIVVVNRSNAKVIRLNLTTTTTTTITCPSKQAEEDEDTVDENSTTTSSHSSSSSSSSGSDSSTTHTLYMIKNEYENTKDNMVSLSRGVGCMHPPLCSKCRNKSPSFGKPPRWFTYGELEKATNGFSEANFLAEGGFGCVHRGVLDDGQNVAVKQHKVASSQGDVEFCSEVEVLSCAQHRNVVMLIGYCIQGGRRLLVYEYICNGSLDSHLWGGRKDGLAWSSRKKIAVGAARGLRYLHEECRVGCIVHRDMRPNNILITHDFQPLVGDFGLARWQPDGDKGVDTRVIGTFGYLAPEYAQSGQVTEKADVYSFGVVLLELMSGRKAVDLNRPKGQQCLSEWARPLLEEYEEMYKVIEPMVMKCGSYSEEEACAMLQAASMCIRRDPLSRPRMSHVLRILERSV